MFRLSFIWCFALLMVPMSRVSAQEFFFRGTEAFDALLQPNAPPLWPDEFVAKYGGVPLPGSGDWLPPARHWVVYRYLGLRYWFEVQQTRSATQMVAALESRVSADPGLKAEFERGVIRIYDVAFATGQRLPVAEIMADPSARGEKEADALKKELQGLEDKLDRAKKAADMADKNGSPEAMENAWRDVRDAEVDLLMGSVIIDGKGQELFNQLRGKYNMPPPGGRLPDNGLLPPAQIWKILAPDMKNGPYDEKNGGLNQQPLTDQNGQSIATETGDGTNKGEPNINPSDSKNGPSKGENVNPGGKKDGGSGSKGLTGFFKVKTPFAKWFSVVMKVVARYFGVEQLANRILFVAYMIAPEVFDACASFLAKCQLAITPGSLNEFLDNVADVYLAIEAFIPYLKQAYELLHDGNLQSLVDHIDWEKFDLGRTLDALEKARVISPDKLNEIKKFAPVDLISGQMFANPDLLRGKIQEYAMDKVVQRADKGLAQWGISVAGLKNCINAADKTGCAADWVQGQAVNAATANIPGVKNHREAIGYLMQGKTQEAVRSAVLSELTHRTGLPAKEMQSIYSALERGDLKEFVLKGAELGLFNTSTCPALAKEAIQAIRSGQASDNVIREAAVCGAEIMGGKRSGSNVNTAWNIGKGMADAVRQYGSVDAWAIAESNRWKNKLRSELKARGYNDLQIRDWMLGAGAAVLSDQLKKQLNVLGFNAPGAVEAVLDGDMARAIDLQMQYDKGSPVPLKEKVRQMRQLFDLREQYLNGLQNDIRQRLKDPNYLEAEILKRVTKKTR